MKKMFSKFLTIGICFFALQACNKDDDKEYRVSLATVAKTLEVPTSSYYFLLDSGTGLNPSTSEAARFASKVDQRYFIWYTLQGENQHHAPKKGYDIDLLQYRSVLTKGTINLNAANADSIGNDPVRVLDIWCGGGFMNIRFAFGAGGSTTHFINLVKNTLTTPPADGKIHLELRHNANKDPKQILVRGFVCFNVKPYQVDGKKTVDFVIKVRESDTLDKTYNVTYNYDTNSTSTEEVGSIMSELETEGYK